MNLKHQFVNGSGSGYTGESTRKRKLEVLNQDPGMSIVSSDPGSHFPNSGETTSFPTLNPKFDKPKTDHSLRNDIHLKHNSQSGGYTWKDMHVSAVSRTCDDNEIQNSNVVPTAPRTLQSKGLSPIGIPAVIEIPRLPFSQHFTYNIATQIKSRVCQEQVKVIPALEHAVRNHFMDAKDSKNMFSFQTHLTENSASPDGGTHELVKNEIKPPSGPFTCISAHVPQDHIWINSGHNSISGGTLSKPDSTAAPFIRPLGGKHTVEMIGSDGSCVTHSGENSGQIRYSFMNTTVQPCDNQPFVLVDESKPTTRNVMNPPTAGKLWDGTLQLSTSTIVSAVAFFKSGEKASELNWSQYIEVKGKVRLEAFEKFIQELPRSRRRALMVISLCWKVGSSETGLTSMKEITKTYREGQKVGYAQLSPGTDLYVCPRSDTIITILAKYGFFKGMAAVEEDQDSLIGCVVWRRSLAPSSAKAMESKKLSSEKSSDSPTKESARQAAGPISTLAITHESEKIQSILRSQENASKPSPVQPRGLIVPENKILSTLISSMTPTLVVDSTTDSSVNSVLMTTEMQPDSDLNIKQPLSTGAELPQGPQNKDNSSDDDDLPEFDFVAACGTPRALKGEISRTSEQTSLTVIHNTKQLNVKQSVSLCEASKTSREIKVSHFSSTLPVIDLSSVPSKVVDHFSEKVATMQRTEVLRSPGKRENDISAAQGVNFHGHQKKFWDDGDDDDDMPEWCPPDMDIGNSPSSLPRMLPHHPFYHPDHERPEPQPQPLPPGPLAGSQLRQCQQGSEHYQERAIFPPSGPSRLPIPDYRTASGRGFSHRPPATSNSPLVDRGTLMPQMPPFYRQSSEDSPSRSPSFGHRFQSSLEHDRMSPLDREFVEDQLEWRYSAGNASGKFPGSRQYGKSGGKPDRFCRKHQHETSKRRYIDLDMKFDYHRSSPKRRESLRCQLTGFDVLPISPRATHGNARDQHPRRRPSLFDVKPRDPSNHSRW